MDSAPGTVCRPAGLSEHVGVEHDGAAPTASGAPAGPVAAGARARGAETVVGWCAVAGVMARPLMH